MASISATSTPLDEFTMFPKLSTDIRLKIWRRTYPAGRVVGIRYNYKKDRNTTKSLPPIALWFNQESRAEALPVYKLVFGTKARDGTGERGAHNLLQLRCRHGLYANLALMEVPCSQIRLCGTEVATFTLAF